LFQLAAGIPAEVYKQKLLEKGIRAFTFGPDKIRFVTHLEITADDIDLLEQRLKTR
jgi:threonine aldolase